MSTPPTDEIGYATLLHSALLGVVQAVLTRTAEHGLPGQHLLYLSFRTDGAENEAVELSDSLRAAYPQEMTIVLQHQFWDLEVTERTFAVTLAFGGVRERVVVPFGALTEFSDPSVGLRLSLAEPPGGDAEPAIEDAEAGEADRDSEGADVVSLADRRRSKEPDPPT